MSIFGTGTSAFYAKSRIDMTTLRKHAEKLQGQLATGQRLERSSDDPVAASQMRVLARADRLAAVDVANTNRATADLQLADAALSSMVNLVTQVRDLSIQAGSDALNEGQRTAIGIQIGEIHAQLVALANARDVGGHALFGGQATGDAYTVEGAYIGTAAAEEMNLGEGHSVIRSITGPEIFAIDVDGTSANLLDIVKDLSLSLTGRSADAALTARIAVDGLTAGIDTIATSQTVLGARLVWLDFVAERQIDLGEMRAVEEADIGGTDIADTMMRLQQAMTILEASQAGFSRLSSLTLFDHIG